MKGEARRLLREIVNEGQEIYSIICKVNSVDTSDKTCDCSPIYEGADLLDIKLNADNKTGFLIIPKVGSIVIVTMTSDQTGYVGMFSEVQEIQLNGGNYGGLPQIEKLVDKYNQIEKSINDLKQIFASWTPVSNDGGAALKALVVTWLTAIVQTQKQELENTTVKHGG